MNNTNNMMKFKETGILEENVMFRVDEYGFFLYWQPEGKVIKRAYYLLINSLTSLMTNTNF